MKSCDDCPGGASCAGNGLHPVLTRVFDLYESGVTDKFAILAALPAEDEALLERYNERLSPICWSKAALLSIAEILARLDADNEPDDLEAEVARLMSTACKAFARFPWRIEDLKAEAPALHERLREHWPDDSPWTDLGKRAFVKLCGKNDPGA